MNGNEQGYLSGSGIHTGYKTVGEYRIYLEWENGFEEVRFRVEETSSGVFEFSQSHHIKTPEQADAYHTSRTQEKTQNDALHRAVGTIMDWYNPAGRAIAVQLGAILRN